MLISSRPTPTTFISASTTPYTAQRTTSIPDTGDIPLVADISSCILSEPDRCFTKFGVLYAGAQKNMAPAGLTVVIVREDLLGNARPTTPAMLNWQAHGR